MKTLERHLDSLSDDVLLARVAELVGRSRRVEAELVRHLAEVDRRRLYLREACPSMHVYATSRLHLSDAEAYLRITAARLSRRSRRCSPCWPREASPERDRQAGAAPARRKRRGVARAGCSPVEARDRDARRQLAPRPDVPSRMRRLPDAKAPASPSVRLPVRPESSKYSREVAAIAPSAAGWCPSDVHLPPAADITLVLCRWPRHLTRRRSRRSIRPGRLAATGGRGSHRAVSLQGAVHCR